MCNLLSAGFVRLRKSLSFWIAMAVMSGVGVLEAALSRWAEQSSGNAVSLDMRYMIFALLAGIVLSGFCSLFVGAEYSSGTIRNKIAAGHTRTAVYLCNLILCAAAGVFLCIGYIVPFLAFGIPLLGFFETGLSIVLRCTLYAFLMTAALSSVFTMLSMLNQNRAATAVISISLAYFLLFLGIFLYSRLSEPEIIPAQEYIQDGQILLREAAPNPGYVQGIKRLIYQFLFRLPGPQAVRLAVMPAEPLRDLPLASVSVLLLSSGIGLFLFRKKDIK